ncbi:hypothetical protein P8452_57046 [Trifolium repens]|nr:hypothetical protein P8452_57046 [Trifolium repens]
MTGVKKYLKDLKGYTSSFVTFGDGAKGEILGIGKLINNDLPNLENVLLEKGLTANLISISQLCDQGLKVSFTKLECLVSNEEGEVLMRGTRSKDNCYLWAPQEEAHLGTCLLSKEDEVQLWHQKLGHLNLNEMKKAVTVQAIRGLPKLKIVDGSICGECQIGKQTRMSHPKLEHHVTSKPLELLHMDLMGPMQVESLGGKRYAFEVVNDFTRYTWVNFIREKSDTFDIFKTLSTQVQRDKNCGIVRIRSDHVREFENTIFSDYCSSEGIKHEFSSPITPQLNDVATKKGDDVEQDVGTSGPFMEDQEIEEQPVASEEGIPEEITEEIADPPTQSKGPSVRVQKNHPKELIIGNPDQGITTRRSSDVIANSCFVSMFEPKFVKLKKVKFMIAQIYVDDIVFGGMSNTMVQHFVKQMQSEFEMSLQIKQMKDIVSISQSKYARNIVRKFGMENASHKRTPAPTHLKLTKDEKGVNVDPSLYRSMIGSLLYLTASRPDITYVVGVCARYQAEPKMSHLNQVKRIMKYVNGTRDYGMMYSHCNSTLLGYCDADWAGSANDRKNTSGGCFFLGNNLISCFSKKQNCVALSTAEAEYIAVESSCSQLVWMKQMLKEYDMEQDVITLYCDNLSVIYISKNPVQHSKTKHIDIRHHFIRDLVESKVVTLEHVATEEQIADIFTKALDAKQFEYLRGKLGICLHEEL